MKIKWYINPVIDSILLFMVGFEIVGFFIWIFLK